MDLEADNKPKEVAMLGRGFAIWLIIIVAEIIHGIARGLLLVPLVGEFRSSQIGVFTGSIIVLVIAYFANPERQHTPRRPVEEVIWQ